MRIIATLSVALALATGRAVFAGAAADGHVPMDGGVVVEEKVAQLELVAKADPMRLGLRDHGEMLNPAKASVKLTLLSCADKQQVALASVGDKLEELQDSRRDRSGGHMRRQDPRHCAVHAEVKSGRQL